MRQLGPTELILRTLGAPATVPISPRSRELAVAAAEAASDKLAEQIVAFDVSEQLVITDAFVICSAPNDRQVKAIVDAVEERLRSMDAKPARREGEREGRWVLLDYIDVIVHVQHAEERVYYSLERLWKDCPTVELPPEVTQGRSRHEERDARGAAS
ncbi:MAG: ribosome-associated protein [Actinomycetota bacterium]|nr:ribosome-associated protein [Actinomycetota bacterium]MDQ1615270.1 ribosome-associated protein [Actinomycetota bacterium]